MSQSTDGPPSPPSRRRVNRSCLECTRRKVKCDGRQPCSSCTYYRAACGYRERSRRNAVSRSAFDKASEQLESQARVLGALFPGVELSDLAQKSPAELLVLLPVRNASSLPQSARPVPEDDGPVDPAGPVNPLTAGDDSGSDSGEPPAERQWEESLDQPATVAASDDVNAIGLAVDHQTRSYLGMTSLSAVFRAIFRLCPAAKEYTARHAREWTVVEPQPRVTPFRPDPALDMQRERRCIDAYFEHIHTITPILDEADFRKQYASDRSDAPFKGLLNMVFALGSIASGSDTRHNHYYHEARSYVGLDILGSGNMEGLQTLCLLGGYYLHYRNSPNTAYSILGAAHRVAIALGLHREPRRRPAVIADPEEHQRRVETRRRTWWGLFCLDTWSSMPQGRPTCGRWVPSSMDTPLPSTLYAGDEAGLSLQASVQFCLICDRIQQRFAQITRLSTRELLDFDRELHRWYEALPPSMMDATNPAPRFHVAREFMRNRYFGVRLILCRSVMLYLLYEWKKGNVELVPDPKQQQMLETGAQVTSQAIDCIALHWMSNRVNAWNSGWYLFQACMVSLLYIAMDRTIHKSSPRQSHAWWRSSLGKALDTFAEMRPWMRASDRAPEIVAALYEALTAESDGPIPTPSASDSLDIFDIFEGCDEPLDWSVYFGNGNFGQGTFP